MIIMIKKYFKNNIKIIILLKYGWTKNNFEITITNHGSKENCKIIITYCDFKDIYETFKIIIITGGFIYFKKKNSYRCLYGCKKINLTNILRCIIFTYFGLTLRVLAAKVVPPCRQRIRRVASREPLPSTPSVRFSMVHVVHVEV